MEPKKTDRKQLAFVLVILVMLLCFAYPTVTKMRNNALESASKSGDAATAKVMLTAGADPNKGLIEAISGNRPKVVEVLLSHGADVNRKDADGGTPLTAAVIYRRMDIIPILLKHGADIKEPFPGGNTALGWSAMAGDIDTVALLAENGADVNTRFGAGFTPMMLAAERGDMRLAQVLLKKGADINAKSPSGSALLSAIENGNTDVARFLIAHGADVNLKSKEGRNANMGITSSERLTIMMNGGSTRQISGSELGNTPLSRAVALGHSDIAQMLIDHGADINAKDLKGYTPLAIARATKNELLTQLLQKAGAKG